MVRLLKDIYLKEVNSMKIHTDEKENYKKKIDKMKDDMARRNKEIQKEREKKKK